jgi:hypothetical protein
MKTLLLVLIVCCFGITTIACDLSDTVVVDEVKWLEDGSAMSWRLEPGTYKVEITANNDGAAVEWVGAPCAGTAETATFSGICELTNTGQVVVKNPSVLNSGLATSVTVRITKMARS